MKLKSRIKNKIRSFLGINEVKDILTDKQNDSVDQDLIYKITMNFPNLNVGTVTRWFVEYAKTPRLKLSCFISSIALYTRYPLYKDTILAELENIYDPSLLKFTDGSFSAKSVQTSILCYINFLICKHKNEKALVVLNDYLKLHDKESISEWSPIAYLADRNGITSEHIARSAEIYAQMEKDKAEDTFKNILRGKTIAIVGNGPQELGTGNGSKIDGYDIVIRFNNFKLVNVGDYGKKIDIHCRNKWEDSNNDADFFLFFDIYNHPIYNPVINDIMKYKNIIFIYEHFYDLYYEEVYNNYNIDWPTSGFMMLYTLKKMGLPITKSDVYGMSFKEGVFRGGHHYESIKYGGLHDSNFNLEIKALNDIFDSNKNNRG
jgi:hypothetical protein